MKGLRASVKACLLLVCLSSCRQDMHDQPSYRPLEESSFFDNGQSSRQPVEGTVARGHLRADQHFYTGRETGGEEFSDRLPLPLTPELLKRGQQQYDIFCTPCHDRAGQGQGIIVRRGFPPPPSFHSQRSRDLPAGYLFDVISNGFRRMYSYGSRIQPRDRWAIIAYMRALQLSRRVRLDQLRDEEQARLREME